MTRPVRRRLVVHFYTCKYDLAWSKYICPYDATSLRNPTVLLRTSHSRFAGQANRFFSMGVSVLPPMHYFPAEDCEDIQANNPSWKLVMGILNLSKEHY